MARPTVCLDVGSGWVKALGVDAEGGPLGCAVHPTTPDDLLRGAHAASAAIGVGEGVELLASSSAGGGLRLAVVGQDRLASTEAGHRAAYSAGARVVHVHAGRLEPASVRALRSSRPDVVLLLGGGHGAAEDVLLHNAARLARARVRSAIVLAGRAACRPDALALLRSTGRTVLTSDDVLPPGGEIVPDGAREVISGLLFAHLIGTPGSASARFRRLARVSTPAAVRRGAVELARLRGDDAGGVLVIDIGSSTTVVHSALGQTVEADLGLRLTAPALLIEAQAAGLVDPVEADLLDPTVRRLAEEPDWVPTDVGAAAEDRRLAALAAVLATRRHLRAHGDRLAEVGVGLVVLTSGVFRQQAGPATSAVVSTVRADPVLRELLGTSPMTTDDGYALAPAGLLAAEGRVDTARTILEALA